MATFLSLLFLCAPAQAEVILDPTFGLGGVVRTAFGSGNSDTPRDLLVQPDGKILTAGISTGTAGWFVAISRHTEDGVPDSTGFGIDGKVLVHWTLRDQANAIDLMEDGRIIAVGMQANSNSAWAQIGSVYRFHDDGTPDTTFADSGCVAIRPMSGGSEHGGVKALPGGRILAGGRQSLSSPGFHMREYLSDGALWGGNLLSIGAGDPSPDPYNPTACAFPDGGGIVLASTASVNGLTQFVLARVDGDLNPAAGFGVNGIVQTGIEATFNRVRRVLVLSDGKILLAGTTPRVEGNTHWTALRFHADGTLDSTFGVDGRTDISFGATGFNNPYDVTIDSSGRILLAGRVTGPLEAALVRLLPDGGLDSTFSDDGKFAIDLNGTGGSHYFTRVLVLPDGRILTAGYDYSSNAGDFFLARFSPADLVGVDETATLPDRLSVRIAPNPSRRGTSVHFHLPREQAVTVEIFDVAGRRVQRLFDGMLSPGTHANSWDGRDGSGRETPAGIYFARVSTSEGLETRRLVRVR